MTRNGGALGVVVLAVVCIAASATAQNQIFNGSFEKSLRGWVQEDWVLWSPSDAHNVQSSGSVLVVNTLYHNGRGVEQCIAGPAIVPGSAYTYGGMIRIPTGQGNTGWAAVGLRWYGQPACGGDPLDDQPRAQASAADNGFHAVNQDHVLAPAGAASAQFVAYATKFESGGVFVAYLDDLYFGPADTTTATLPAIYVPTAAHLVGYGGINWRTDLEFHNPTQASVSLRLDLLKRDQDNSSPDHTGATLLAGTSMRYGDVLSTHFEFTGAGALRLTPTSGSLAVTSRTYNQTAGGTYGQFVPGIPEYEAVLYGEEARLVQLTHDLSTTTGYRTNIGFVNAVNMRITIEIKLFNSSGTLLGTLPYDLDPFEFKQIDKTFKSVTGEAVADGYAVLRTTTPNGRFFAYASVIDNATGDPICVQQARY